MRCEGCLKCSPIPQETRSPILLNDQHPPSKLIILNIHECNKDSSGKYTLNEFKQKFWLLCGRHIAKNIIRACVTCRKRHCKSYRYPPSPPLTPLRLNYLRPFFTVGIHIFGEFLFETYTLLKMTQCTRHGLHYIQALPAEPFV